MSVGAGSFLSGLSEGAQFGLTLNERKKDRDQADRQMEINRELQLQNQSLMAAIGRSGGGNGAGNWGSGSGSSQSGSGGGVSGGSVAATDPANSTMAGYQKAFLNAISGPESAGRYDVRYTPDGGTTFDTSTGDHPRIYETRPDDGRKSSAAGRYQFTASTWDRMGGGAFTPERQDEMAWKLAVDDYGRRTGRDLAADLNKDGMTEDMLAALTPTWEGLGAGRSKIIDAYNSSLTRYRDQSRATGQEPRAAAPAETAQSAPAALPSLASQSLMTKEQRGASLGKELLGMFHKKSGVV